MKQPAKTFFLMLFMIGVLLGYSEEKPIKLFDEHTEASKGTDSIKIASHFDKVIGEIQDGILVFVANVEELKSNWAAVVNKNSKLNISYTEIKIVLEDGIYFLRGSDTVNHASSVIKLVLDGNKFYESSNGVKDAAGSGLTVTCSGCTSTGPGSAGECSVALLPGTGYYCTACSQGNCTKTESITPGGGIL